MYRILERDHLVGGLILATTVAVFTLKGGIAFPFTEAFAGRDLVGNYAFAVLMEQNLLNGELVAWSADWFLGFPAFVFYPPLLFLVVAGLNIITGSVVGIGTWFALVVFGSVFLIPLITWYGFAPVVGWKEAVFAAGYTFLFLFVYPPVALAYQVLNTGLVAQGFAYALLLTAIALLFREGQRKQLLGGVLLGCTILAHPFVGMVGGITLLSYAALQRDGRLLLPGLVAGVVSAPWLLPALLQTGAGSTYTLGAGNIGAVLLLLTPLAVYGGMNGVRERALLATSLLLAVVAYVPLPLPLQQVRFVTYLFGFVTILAGIGASRLHDWLQGSRYAPLVAGILLLGVAGLVVQAPFQPSWTLEDDVTAFYDGMDRLPDGRVLVETWNRSIHDAYVLQETLPLRTDHNGVNAVHLDGSPSANYILTAEDWVSDAMLANPLCRTCTGERPAPGRLDARLDALGIRYVVTRTPPSTAYVNQSLRFAGRFAGYSVFENTDNPTLVEQAAAKPVALQGDREAWLRINDRLFQENGTTPVVWLKNPPEDRSRFAAVIAMNRSTDAVADRIRALPSEPLPATNVTWTRDGNTLHIATNASVPVSIKESFFHAHRSTAPLYPASFNTMLVYPEDEAVIKLRAQ